MWIVNQQTIISTWFMLIFGIVSPLIWCYTVCSAAVPLGGMCYEVIFWVCDGKIGVHLDYNGCFLYCRFGNTAYLYMSVAFIQMLKALSEWSHTSPYAIRFEFLYLHCWCPKIPDVFCYSACGDISHGCYMWHWQTKVWSVLEYAAGQRWGRNFIIRGDSF